MAGFFCLYQLFRTFEGDVDVRANVVFAKHRVEAGTMEHGCTVGLTPESTTWMPSACDIRQRFVRL